MLQVPKQISTKIKVIFLFSNLIIWPKDSLTGSLTLRRQNKLSIWGAWQNEIRVLPSVRPTYPTIVARRFSSGRLQGHVFKPRVLDLRGKDILVLVSSQCSLKAVQGQACKYHQRQPVDKTTPDLLLNCSKIMLPGQSLIEPLMGKEKVRLMEILKPGSRQVFNFGTLIRIGRVT